ncbi:MAG: AI-2E family transporter [Clostridiales bacterium]|nr:AI-2E family transporter [Clostridiales bacterium]
MKRFSGILSKPWAAYTFAACSAVTLYMLLSHLSLLTGWISSVWKLLSPVFIGVIVAYLINPVSDFFEFRVFKKLKKPGAAHLWAVIMTVLCLVLALAVLLTALIPSLIQSVSKLVSNWGYYTNRAQEIIKKVSSFAAAKNINMDPSKLSATVDNAMTELVGWLKNNSKTVFSTLGSVGNRVSNFAVGILFGVCFLVAEKSLVAFIGRIREAVFKKERLERDNELLRRFHKVFIRYVGCTLLDALIIGIGVLIFTLIMGMPYAGLIAVVCALTNIIPTFGPMIGSAIGIFFLVLDKPLNALWFFIFTCVLQSIDGMIIKPRLFSDSLGIPAVWTLVLIILGGKVAGMLGILLAIPLAAIIVIFYQEVISPRIDRRIAKINGEETKPEEEKQPD